MMMYKAVAASSVAVVFNLNPAIRSDAPHRAESENQEFASLANIDFSTDGMLTTVKVREGFTLIPDGLGETVYLFYKVSL